MCQRSGRKQFALTERKEGGVSEARPHVLVQHKSSALSLAEDTAAQQIYVSKAVSRDTAFGVVFHVPF